MHPKTEIKIDPLAITRILNRGWWGQLKIHGHRVQLHIHADPQTPILAYTRHGKKHSKALSPLLCKELRRILAPCKDWSVWDGEWVKSNDKIYIFDCIKLNGENLAHLDYESRYKIIPRMFISPVIEVLGILTNLKSCLAALENPDPVIEGLVFKAKNSKGFLDSSIIKCRKAECRN